MKAKFEIKKTVEVTLPHYRKNHFYFYKVLNEDGYCISVGVLTEGPNMFAKVEFEKSTFAAFNNTDECTAEEFNEAYKSAINLISFKNG